MNSRIPVFSPGARLLREPLLNFLLLGAMIFALQTWREKQKPAEDKAARIEVTAAVVERLREALAMGLDRDDTILRRRLAQKMEFLTDTAPDFSSRIRTGLPGFPESSAIPRTTEAQADCKWSAWASRLHDPSSPFLAPRKKRTLWCD